MEMIRDDPDLGSNPERMQASLRELMADDYPTIVANLEHLADRAFTFHGEAGSLFQPPDDALEQVAAMGRGPPLDASVSLTRKSL